MKALTLLLAIIISTACVTKPAESSDNTTYTITGSIAVNSQSDLERDYPDTPVYFLAIKHSERRENIRERQALFNALMKEYCDKSEQVTSIDTCTPLLTEEGKADPTFYLEDKLHLGPKGYAVWKEIVIPFLVKDL